jgi:hypothetical protein
MNLASVVTTNNLSVAATSYCTDDSCSVEAHVVALQAECVTSQEWGFPTDFTTWCSTFEEELCVDLDTSSPFAYDAYNFTSGPATECASRPNGAEAGVPDCLAGEFAVIVGAWANYNHDYENLGTAAGYTANTLNCPVHYGISTIVQIGNSAPYIKHDSFTISTSSLAAEEEADNVLEWQSLYPGPYSPFNLASAGDSDVVLDTMVAYLIQSQPIDSKSAPFTNDTNRVARALEQSFDTATLLAFVQAPDASTLEIRNLGKIAVWTYNVKVLAILAAPLLATLLVLSRYWKVQSNYVVIGYDPLKIARRANDILASTIPSD